MPPSKMTTSRPWDRRTKLAFVLGFLSLYSGIGDAEVQTISSRADLAATVVGGEADNVGRHREKLIDLDGTEEDSENKADVDSKNHNDKTSSTHDVKIDHTDDTTKQADNHSTEKTDTDGHEANTNSNTAKTETGEKGDGVSGKGDGQEEKGNEEDKEEQ
jgi:hypothetical protein